MNVRQASFQHSAHSRHWILRGGTVHAVLTLLALLAALPAAPIFQPTPGVISGTALSLGAEILRGRVLYRDLWLNAPPLTALLNAFGLLLGGASRWGVWALEFISILAAALLLYELLKRSFGLFPALFGVAGLLANLVFLYQGGNAAEGYALGLQVGVYILLAGILQDAKPLWRSLMIGLLLGLLVSLKVELVGVGLVVGALLLGQAVFQRSPRVLLHLLLAATGLLLVCAGWAAVFNAQGALPALLDQVFRYNLCYSGVTNPDRVSALGKALQALYWASGFFSLGALAWLVAVPFLFFNIRRFREVFFMRWSGVAPLVLGLLLIFNALWDDRARGLYDFSALSSYRLGLAAAGLVCVLAAVPFLTGWLERWSLSLTHRYPPAYWLPLLIFPLALAFVDLPVQLVFSSLAGQGVGHNYLPLLPSLAILVTFLAWSLLAGRGSASTAQNIPVWLALLALPVLVTGWFATVSSLTVMTDDQALQVAETIRATTRPDQPILQWGDNPQLYFLADRTSASRFYQQRPLFRPGYGSAERVQELIEDLYATSPVILVDTRPVGMPLVLEDCENLQYDDFVEQAVRAQRDARFPLQKGEPLPFYPKDMKAVYRWFCENYEPVPSNTSDPDAWRIYRLHAAKP